jgi:hypothetical protein
MTMPCANTVALYRHEREQDALELHAEMVEREAEQTALFDDELLREMIPNDAGESEADEDLMGLIIAAGVDAFLKGTAPDCDKIEKLIRSREWFATAVAQAKRDLS